MIRTLLTASAIAAIASTASFAQDYSLNPTYGTYSLNAGFLPDPSELQITAGGSLDASSVGCAGAIAVSVMPMGVRAARILLSP